MSNISDLRASREAAGQRYKAASRENYEALIDLMAHDAALATLAGEPEVFRIEQGASSSMLRVTNMDEASSRYANPYQPTNWHADIQARRDAYIRENRQ
jgi:hypothetical protein